MLKQGSPIKIAVGVLALGLAACSQPDGLSEFHDPFEAHNRQVHEFNKNLDRMFVRPVGEVANELPDEITIPVSNFADNVGLPNAVVNNVLQGDLGSAITNTVRFGLNTTLGIGGFFDPASAFGIYEQEADFGQTLAVWGVGEGAYLEIVGLGPTTERDAFGTLVDLIMDPIGQVGTKAQVTYALPSEVAGLAISRGQFSGTVDSVLYESADSYAQSRLLYLQNRRFQLGVETDDTYLDPYSDPYFDPYSDPYEE